MKTMNRKILVILVLTLLTASLVNAHSPQYSEKLRLGPKKNFSRVQGESRSEKVGYNRGDERLIGAIATGTLDDPYGYVTSYGYDGFDRITKITDPLNNITLLGRANTGNLLSLKQLDSTGQQILLQSIRINDPAGRLTSYTVKMPNPDDDIKYTITYEENGKRVIFKDSLERQTIVEKNDDGKVSKVTDAANNVIEYFYEDGRGNPTTIKETVKSADGNEDETKTYTTKYTHNAHNQVETITDLQTQAVTTFYYDEKGNLTGTQDAEGNTITHKYDELGRRIKTSQHFKDTSLKPVETTFDYYPVNTYNNTTHEGTYSPSNLLKSITDDKGNKTIYEYDNQNRLKKVYYPDGTYPDTSSYVEYIYDINEPTGETNADGKPTYYRVVKEIQRNGTVVKHKYDKLQRLMRREIIPAEGSAGTTIEDYTYDGLSRIATAADDDTGLRFEFDRASRLDTEKQGTRQEWLQQAGKLIDYTYNKLSDRYSTELKYPNTRLIEMEYDQLNRMKLIKEGTFTIADMNHIGRSYRLLRKQYGNGDLITYLYDQGRRLQDLEAKNLNNNSLINHYRYGYNKINLRTYEQRMHNADKGDAYGYDSLYRLTNVKLNATDPKNPTEFEKEKSINHDNLHNITSIVETFNGQTRSINPEIPDGSDYSKLNQYARFDQWGLEYDKNGNLKQKGTQRFTHDYRNQLISAVDGTLSVEMKYDVMGRRVQKAVTKGSQTEVRNFYYSGHQLIEERDGNDQVTRQYIYGNGIDEIIRMDKYQGTAVTSYYFHTDSIGSVTAITDSQGNLIERVTYDIYGMPTFWDPTGNKIPESLIGNTILFQGREYDPELNLYYYRARYYDPIMGRFLETDPMGYADSMNLYQGFNMNPVNFRDPMGKNVLVEVTPGGSTSKPLDVGEYYLLLIENGYSISAALDDISNNTEYSKYFLDGSLVNSIKSAISEREFRKKYPNATIEFGGWHSPNGLIQRDGTIIPYDYRSELEKNYERVGNAVALTAIVVVPTLTQRSSGTDSMSYADEKLTEEGVEQLVKQADNILPLDKLAEGEIKRQQLKQFVISRVNELQNAIPNGAKGRITMSVSIAEDEFGKRVILIGTSEPSGYLRPGVILKEDEILVSGLKHAEEDIINYANANGLKIIQIGATRPVCPSCVNSIKTAGGKIVTPIKKVK